MFFFCKHDLHTWAQLPRWKNGQFSDLSSPIIGFGLASLGLKKSSNFVKTCNFCLLSRLARPNALMGNDRNSNFCLLSINCPNVVEVFLSSVRRMTQTSQRSGVNKKTSTTLGQLIIPR